MKILLYATVRNIGMKEGMPKQKLVPDCKARDILCENRTI